VSKAVKVDKDYVEKVVKEDLSGKYPDITELEFVRVTFTYKWWMAGGIFSTARGLKRVFMYVVDGETGEIIEYTILVM
jgi:predicted small secreted protein